MSIIFFTFMDKWGGIGIETWVWYIDSCLDTTEQIISGKNHVMVVGRRRRISSGRARGCSRRWSN